MEWIIKPFSELSPLQVYDFMRLRSEVFVVEQNCVFLDADDKDQESLHLMGYQGALLVAYTRLVPPGVIYDIPSIGRVITNSSVRRSGAGRALMQESIRQVYQHFGKLPIKIGAQLYLKSFYESFGFTKISDVYLEDGIEHIYMMKEPD
ncbi:MAG TPA: GNAT family N-acetyltransferase [Flavisolibacter sp.]|nr:GNAT family N-acetyltransferase [Flavisolibacter sp.]